MAWVVGRSRKPRQIPESNLDPRQFISGISQTPNSTWTVDHFLEKFGFDTALDSSSNESSDKDSDEELDQKLEDTRLGSVSISTSPSKSFPSTNKISEREYLTVAALAQIMLKDKSNAPLAYAFLVHTVVISEVSLSDRPLLSGTGKVNDKKRLSAFMAEFAHISGAILEQKLWSSVMDSEAIHCDVADLIDGRIFMAVSAGSVDFLKLKPKVNRLLQLVNIACGDTQDVSEQELAARFSGLNLIEARRQSGHRISILPFSNPVFDKHLESIKISTDASLKFNPKSARIFQEITHWHNAKRRIDPKFVHHLSEKDKFRLLRREQFFMAEMQAYAASLTNAAGKILEPEIVTVSDGKKGNKGNHEIKDDDENGNLKRSKNTNAASNRKGAGKKLIMENIAAQKASKDSENAEKHLSSWHIVRKGIDLESTLSAKYVKTKIYLRDLTDTKRAILEAEIQFYLLTVLTDIYRLLHRQRLGLADKERSQAEKSVSKDEEYYGVAALIWDTIRRLSTISGLTRTIIEHSKQVLKSLGLPHIDFPKLDIDRLVPFKPNLAVSNAQDLSINLDPIDFQCLYCGPYMDRNLDSKSDPRVPFKPDGWQRQVLDELDANRSVFVVAPTSAGKTFISFYAMERILKANNDGILVYVAPTKALVNQIAAEIQARYKKTYKYPGQSVWAIHTRDYRVNNPAGCQILVTVPHILQIMLLAPSNARGWSTQVKTIIFDEIHSIGNAEDGVVWEQLLLLAPCPIIALSATVGNPEQFSSWLASTQLSVGHQLTMIKHPHRYSDLRKFIFHPSKQFAFAGLPQKTSFATLGLDGAEHLSFVHPVAALVNKSRGIPDDLSLEARDCLSLWHAINKFKTPQYPVDSSLGPGIPSDGVVRKADIFQWELKLKNLLKIWMRDNLSPFDKVIEYLGEPMNNSPHPEYQASSYAAADPRISEPVMINKDDLLDTTLPLICKLYERNCLPAIFFNYDRSKCEQICQELISQLKGAEAQWKAKSPSWKKKLSDWEQWKLEQTKLAGRKPPKILPKSKRKDDDDDLSSKADRAQDVASTEASPFASFDPEAPLDGFHFAVKHKAESSELSRYYWQMKKRGLPDWLTEGLSRGIGVHHAGMNRKYRQV